MYRLLFIAVPALLSVALLSLRKPVEEDLLDLPTCATPLELISKETRTATQQSLPPSPEVQSLFNTIRTTTAGCFDRARTSAREQRASLVPKLLATARGGNDEEQEQALRILRTMDLALPEVLPALLDLLADEDEHDMVRKCALFVLEDYLDQMSWSARLRLGACLLAVPNDMDRMPSLRFTALCALEELALPESLRPAYVDMLMALLGRQRADRDHRDKAAACLQDFFEEHPSHPLPLKAILAVLGVLFWIAGRRAGSGSTETSNGTQA